MSPLTYFKSIQFQWAGVIFLIGVGLATLAALVAWLGDASRAATGDVKARDVQPLPLIPPPPMN